MIFVVAGGEEIHYGWDKLHTGAPSFKEWVLKGQGHDPERFIFTGRVLPEQLAAIFRMSDLHIYLTAPFVLSWSLLDAMASGCVVLGVGRSAGARGDRAGKKRLDRAALRCRTPDRNGATCAR